MVVIDLRRLYKILDHTPATHNIMLVGRHGIGKSQILTEYFGQRGMRVVPLFLGQMSDPGDLIGLPQFSTDGRTAFAPPYWFPTDGQPIVLFLDELNRARPEILQTVMDLTLNRCLAGHQLPPGSRLIAAVNDGDEYQLTHLDPALVSRFNVYQFMPTHQEWLLWAESNGVDSRVTAFIQNEPSLLDGTPELKAGEDTGLEKYPDRRAWWRVSEVLTETSSAGHCKPRQQIDEDDLDMIAGIIGAQAASRFYAFVQGRQMLSGSQILNDFAACEAQLRSYRLHQLAIINEGIFRQLQVDGMGQITEDSDELRAMQTQRYATNLSAYYAFLEDIEQREAIAHLANLFQGSNYEQAILFVVNYCPELYQKMMDFISNL